MNYNTGDYNVILCGTLVPHLAWGMEHCRTHVVIQVADGDTGGYGSGWFTWMATKGNHSQL